LIRVRITKPGGNIWAETAFDWNNTLRGKYGTLFLKTYNKNASFENIYAAFIVSLLRLLWGKKRRTIVQRVILVSSQMYFCWISIEFEVLVDRLCVERE
jgi:hypothetical protein